jgi:hypothetical protein
VEDGLAAPSHIGSGGVGKEVTATTFSSSWNLMW